MTIENDIALLARIPTFATLRTEALRIMAIGAESKAIGNDEVLFNFGETADCGYVIESGAFKLIPPLHGQPVIASRGALLGELALITETRRPVTAVAREPSMVMRIARPLFLRMLEGYPEVAEQLRQELLARTEQLADGLRQARYAFDVSAAAPPAEPAAAPSPPEPPPDA
jgi:CRP-like cAMP-binding protein